MDLKFVNKSDLQSQMGNCTANLQNLCRVNFFGDVSLYDLDVKNFSIDPEILRMSNSAHLNVANLESPLTNATERRPYKHVYMKGVPAPSHIFDLFDAFTLANNHMLDYNEDGLTDTVKFLSSIQKKSFGVGTDRQSSFEPLLVHCEGIRIALLGCSQWQNAGRSCAGTTPNNSRELCRKIRELEGAGHFVVVFPHWNYEYIDYPAPANRSFARKLIDAGAHIVVGSHPHVIQGFEIYRNRYIFHSLGNFIFKEFDVDDARLSDTFILSILIHGSRQYEVQVVPVHTDEKQIRIMDQEDSARLQAHIGEISSVFDDEQLYKIAFYEQATRGSDRITGELKDMIQRYGIMYILSRLHRITIQDLKIKFHSKFRQS